MRAPKGFFQVLLTAKSKSGIMYIIKRKRRYWTKKGKAYDLPSH